MYIEDRTTYQCHASYKTIGNAVNMSPNTVRKYVTELVERGLIKTEHTSIITQDGRKQNGSLLYTLLPIQFSIQQFYEQSLQSWTRNVSRNASESAWKRSNWRSRKPPVHQREPRVAAVSGFPGTAGRVPTGSSKPDVAPPCDTKIRPKPSAAGSVERGDAAEWTRPAACGKCGNTPKRAKSRDFGRRGEKAG